MASADQKLAHRSRPEPFPRQSTLPRLLFVNLPASHHPLKLPKALFSEVQVSFLESQLALL